jgi:hypothetical protein
MHHAIKNSKKSAYLPPIAKHCKASSSNCRSLLDPGNDQGITPSGMAQDFTGCTPKNIKKHQKPQTEKVWFKNQPTLVV